MNITIESVFCTVIFFLIFAIVESLLSISNYFFEKAMAERKKNKMYEQYLKFLEQKR